MVKNIPTVYKLIHNKLVANSFNNEINVKTAREILSRYFRVPPFKVTVVLHELHEYKLIKLNHNKIAIVLKDRFELWG